AAAANTRRVPLSLFYTPPSPFPDDKGSSASSVGSSQAKGANNDSTTTTTAVDLDWYGNWSTEKELTWIIEWPMEMTGVIQNSKCYWRWKVEWKASERNSYSSQA
ncbi:hypothetical protein LINPERPRIM_LOCUS27376, partial [Linum perenne]